MRPKKSFGNHNGSSSKIFVGGLSMEATEEDLSNYFEKYGIVRSPSLNLLSLV